MMYVIGGKLYSFSLIVSFEDLLDHDKSIEFC
jgi:hypothetical protein